MDYLEAKMDSREMEGVKISDFLTIYCHKCFADNVTVFIPTIEESFEKLKVILKLYEVALGARLNFAKLVIIPLMLPAIPQWLIHTGCTMSALGEVQKYLGAPFGLGLISSQLHDFCIDRVSKRIKGWANFLVSFNGRVLLIQHVLQSIYHMMYVCTWKP